MATVVTTVNWLNGTTVAGLLVAKAAKCELSRRGEVFQASGYRYRLPLASAFTIGSVVITRRPLPEGVWTHELAHVRQYAWCGPMFLPLYGFAATWSWLRSGDWWSRNVFERRAGLVAGGYRERPLRPLWRRGGTVADAAAA